MLISGNSPPSKSPPPTSSSISPSMPYVANVIFGKLASEACNARFALNVAIAIAIRVDAPIFVTANVLSNGSVSTDTAKDEEEAQEFKNFIQSIKPSDFAKLMKDNERHESDQ